MSVVPPLEDMSEVLAAAARLRKSRHVGLHQSATQTSASVVETIAGKETCTPVVKVHEVSKDSRTDKSSSSTMKSKPPVASTLSGASSSSSGFGGMKKGFLLDSGRKKQSKAQVTPHPKPSDAAASSVPLIKPNQPKDASRVLPEVQKAMKAAMSALEKKEWITDDLLDKISSHPTIGPKLSDPRYSAALDCFQKNPQQASKEYRGQPEIQAFLRDFCRILGEHFTSLEEKQKAKGDWHWHTHTQLMFYQKQIRTSKVDQLRCLERQHIEKVICSNEPYLT